MSSLEFLDDRNGWGPIERDRSNGENSGGDGNPMSIRGAKFDKGVGTHADSEFEVYTGGKCDSAHRHVGVDDETNGNGTVRFEVLKDGVSDLPKPSADRTKRRAFRSPSTRLEQRC